MASGGFSGWLPRPFLAQLARTGVLVALAIPLGGVALAVCGDGTTELGEDCDDGNNVDGDCCSSACGFESSGNPCSGATLCRQSGACDGAGTCAAVPRTNCRTALKSRVLLSDNNGNDAKDKLRWKWGGGDATTLADLGVPTGTTTYALCIYAANDLIEEPEIAPDPCGSHARMGSDTRIRLGRPMEFRRSALHPGQTSNRSCSSRARA